MPMVPPVLINREVRRLLERHFLELANDEIKAEYVNSSDCEKRDALKAFLRDKAGGAKAWATVLQDLL
jgi:hypothetical protein